MAHRLIRIVCVVVLACAGLFGMHRGTALRVAAEPEGTVALPSATESADVAPPGLLSEAGQVELRTPERVQVLGPAVARTGEGPFHLGVGLATAAFALAILFVLGGGGSTPSRAISLLWLLPAGWALWKMGTEGGPAGATGAAAFEAWSAYAPVFAGSLLLGASWGARKVAG